VKFGVLVFMFLNFNARGILSIFETINVPIFLAATGLNATSDYAVSNASSFHLSLGLLGLLSYIGMEVFRNCISDTNWLHLGFFSLALGNGILLNGTEATTINYTYLAVGEYFIWSVGCPLTTAVSVAAFSKMLGGRPQGTWMGLLGSSGSLARIILPALPTITTSYSQLYWINIILCSLSGLVLAWYNRNVQYNKSRVNIVDFQGKVNSPPLH